ncbi:MAG: hypothetical protein JWM35_2031 [Verrucomicrobia bacterium]|nr:hypothetical protein [Verrucomicrobiota bacterium]
MTKFRPLSLLLLALPLFLAGCGGGGSALPANSQTTILAPKTLIGGVMVANYPDGRSYTFHINSTAQNGVTRSDGKTTTQWIATGYGTGIMSFQLAYGAFTAGSSTNIFDDYTMTFTSTSEGVLQVRENTSNTTYSTTPILTGNFKFTTYPPGG